MNTAGEPTRILVLGGTSEIGLACVQALAGPALRQVILAGRDLDRLRAAASALAIDASVDVVELDAADPATHGDIIASIAREHATGDIDCALVCVGLLGDQHRMEADPALAIEVARVNYTGVVSLGLHLAQHLTAQGHGTLVVFSSVAGQRARRANFVYGSSKAGADAFAQGLGDALAGTGVRVMLVRPGFVRTRMTAGLPDAPLSVDAPDVAVAVARGLARDADVVWVPRALRLLAVVLRALPRSVLRRLPR